MTQSAKKPSDNRGLAGLTAGETSICSVNQTQLIYRGYEIADLAANASFEEVAFLLLVGHKPTAEELKGFDHDLKAARTPPAAATELIRQIAQSAPETHPMSALRTAVSMAGHLDAQCEDNGAKAELAKSIRLTAMIPALIGAHQTALDGNDLVQPNPDLSHAGNLLWCMTGEKPGELATKVMDISLVLYAEHDFNASTFTSRVVASTASV